MTHCVPRPRSAASLTANHGEDRSELDLNLFP
jgi:hypothetical protein